MRLIGTVYLILLSFVAWAQNPGIRDSLSAIAADENAHDTSRAAAHIELSEQLYLENPDTVFPLCNKAIEIIEHGLAQNPTKREHTRLLQLKLYAYGNMGAIHTMLGNMDEAMQNLEKSITIAKELGDEKQQAFSLNTLANIYASRGEVQKAIANFQRSLKLFKAIHDSSAISGTLNNIGVQYKLLGDYRTALNYHNKALEVSRASRDTAYLRDAYTYTADVYFQTGDFDKAMQCYKSDYEIAKKQHNKFGLANTLQKMGSIYMEQGKFQLAKAQLEEALQVNNSIDNKSGVQGNYSFLGDLYYAEGDDQQALEYYQKALDLAEQLQEKTAIAEALQNIGNLLYNKGDFRAARTKLDQALKLAQEVGYPEYIKDAAGVLSKVEDELGNKGRALEMYRLYIQMRDSLKNEANQREVMRQQFQHAFEKKEAVSEKEHELELKAQEDAAMAESKRQSTIIFAIAGGLGIVLLFSIFLFNRFRVTRRQKAVIETQKQKVDLAYGQLEEKNKEIMDSITYAKRIQSAILPPNKLVKEYLCDSFILYKPKDIVAGDFYWVEAPPPKSPSPKGEGDLVYCAVCDCTGHGVPGAMVSVVCNNGLNRAVREYKLQEPGEILDKTRELVVAEFEKSEEEVADGMDVALCSLSLSTLTLSYAGANNPLWVIRKGGDEVEEIKADKQPIGKYTAEKPFTTHTVQLNTGDTIYIFSDGMADQFGGSNGKKFKSSNLKKLLLSIQGENMENQRKRIDDAFEQWRGDLEQVDDVCMMGVRV